MVNMQVFHAADSDTNKRLTIDEFQSILFPGDHENMKEQVVIKIFLSSDINKDGVISRKEYKGQNILLKIYQ